MYEEEENESYSNNNNLNYYISETVINQNNSYFVKLEKKVHNKLIRRYSHPNWFYNAKMINDILYNEKTHYVEMFKEYLLYEDYNEFLRQYYGKSLLKTKLQKILNFYEKYSKIFPNYTALRESKYLYKNIKRKQKVINQINENKRNENLDLDEESYSSYNKTIFNSKVINSIYTGHNTITINKNNDNNTLLTNDNSVCNFIEQISILEKETKKIKEQKNKIKEDKNTYKKNGQINFKKLSNLLVNSSNYNSNNFIKNRVKIDFKRNFIERHPNTSNKIKLNPYNYISKQKSYSNIIGSNKKISSTNKNDITNINNNSRRVINNNSIMAKTNGLKYYLDYEKYKKILLSTNSTNTPKIMPERMLSSPKRIKNIRFAKKRCISNSRVGSNYNNNCLKRNMNSTNALSKNSIFKNNRNNISNSNILKDEKKLLKCQINKQSKNKLLNNFHPESVNKYYSNNISHLNTKNKNTRKNNVYNNKNKIVNNYNIMNGIMNNSTQINIYTGNDLIKSLNLYWNSIINSTKSNSPFYDSNLSKKKLGIKSLSKKNKKIKNMKQIIEKHMKEKKLKEPNTERNSSNEKLLKLLDIYCKGVKKHRNTNMKKNNVIKNKLNKSHIYKTKSRTKYEERSIKDFIYKKSKNIFDIFKDKEKNISSNTSTNKKNLIKTNRIIK